VAVNHQTGDGGLPELPNLNAHSLEVTVPSIGCHKEGSMKHLQATASLIIHGITTLGIDKSATAAFDWW
jgi:hypothetical protein